MAIDAIWIGTTNKGKLSEFRILFDRDFPGLKIHSLSDLPTYTQPPENGQTFLDNARIKAKSLKAMKPGTWVMAEDSGLEVKGLGNLPGIHSARYAGPKASDSENVAKLLKMMQIRQIGDRSAHFLCTMVVYTPAGDEWILTGTLDGKIAQKATGTMGFGYDPVFIPNNETKTLAELGPGFKNQNSHRAAATRALIEKIKNHV